MEKCVHVLVLNLLLALKPFLEGFNGLMIVDR